MVRSGGILCGDDLELQADECDIEFARMHQTVDFVLDPRTGKHYHPGVTLAVDEAFGRVTCFDGFWAMQKIEQRFEAVSLSQSRGVIPPHWPETEIDKIKAYFAVSDEIAALV